MMTTSYSNSLVLEDSEKGVVVRGIKDETVAAKSGLQAGDELAAATINLDQLNKDDVMKILKVLEPYNTNMKVLTKKEMSASAGLGSLGLGLNDSSELLNMSKDLSLDASTGTPGLTLGDLNGKINAAQGLNGGISGPTLNGDLPGLSLNNPTSDTDFQMPSLSLSGSDIKGDLDGSIRTSDVSVSAPQINSPTASVSVNKPEIKSPNYKAPKFTMPNFSLPQLNTPKANVDVSGDTDLSLKGNVDTAELNLSAPKLDVNKPDLDLNGPKLNLNGSDVNVGIPDADANIEAPSAKFKWPHQKWKPKIKGPDADLNAELPTADVNLSSPKLDGKLNTPGVDVNLPSADIQGPDLNAQAPNLEVDPPSGKFNFSKLKNLHFRKPNADLDANLNAPNAELSVPKVDGEIKTPDVDLSLPKADLEGPDLNVTAPGINAEAPSGKIIWPHQKWKKPKVQAPKADLDMDADLNLKSPKIGGDVNLPNAELNLPKADLDVPDAKVDINAPPGGIDWPHLKWKKPRAKTDMDLNASLGTPKLEGNIDTPDLSLPKGNVDMKIPDADLEAPSGKIKFPTWKKPKLNYSGPKVNAPDLNAGADIKAPDLNLNPELNGPDVDLKLPEANLDVKTPNADIEAPSGKLKWPTFKKKKFTLPDAKIEGPDVEGANLNLSAPKADINCPDISTGDIKTDVPGVESPSGKLKWFTWKKGKGTLKTPKLDLDADMKGPDVAAPDVNLSTPKLDGNIGLPEADLKVGDLDLQGQDMTLNLPKADLKGPDVGLSAPKSNFGLSEANVKTPNLDLPDFKVPDLSLSSSEIDGNFSGAGLPKVEMEAPDAKLNTPNLDLNLPNVEHKQNFPHFKLPNLSGTEIEAPSVQASADAGLKAPNLDLGTADANLSAPGIDLSAPQAKGGIKGPELDIDTPSVDANVEKPKWPHFKLPDFGLLRSKSEPPEIGAGADVRVNSPGAEGKIALPDFNASASEGGVNLNTVTDVISDDSSIPVFRFHRLPRHSMDGTDDFDLYKLAKIDSEDKEYVMSKGIRLPMVNAKSTSTEKINILERLKRSMEKSPSTNVSPTDARSSIDLQVPSTYLDASAGDSSLVRGGTFKVEKPDSSLSLNAPEISTTDENDKLSLGLSNMLGLNVKDPDAV